ncbi:AP2 domain-containing protein [Streptococcus gordonii]|uniref:AP2 domain-containing protein n=1 Tax=Streptococcus gordonii TaxID=1302 RepID=UPI001CBD0434|nr:AP2 domain-containing protein [Streptococcus gordonii]MBZ2138955.1 AP2 domain-containing protein [Streptococcus gordonii]
MREDIIGQRFNRLVVIEDDGTRSAKGEIKWLCQCDCGNLYHALGYRLRNGRTKSCGCLNDERRRERFKDLSGTETDNFKIIDRAYSKNQRVWWNCICRHCGNELILSNNDINHYTSCGCLRGASKDYMDSIRDPESLKSTKPTAKSTTGVRGVYFNKRKGSYQAFINVDKKQKYLGSSKDFRKAVSLRKNAEKEFWGK